MVYRFSFLVEIASVVSLHRNDILHPHSNPVQ